MQRCISTRLKVTADQHHDGHELRRETPPGQRISWHNPSATKGLRKAGEDPTVIKQHIAQHNQQTSSPPATKASGTMATEETVQLSEEHTPHQASVDAIDSILETLKDELVKLRRDHDSMAVPGVART
jgi:hypothetical protein